jgi:hypothetical protein
MRIAEHLEAIYLLAKNAPKAQVFDHNEMKAEIVDILHRISNGMQVSEGHLVQSLEKLYRAL